MNTAFHAGAEFYEVLSDSDARLEREGPLLLDVLRQAPGVRVVDLASGTGLHARFLAEHGATVTAMDISPEMTAHARERRSHPHIEFCARDMRDLDGGPWDLAVCLGNSLSLLHSLDEIAETMTRVFHALTPGGLFVVQLLNYQADRAQEPRHRVERRQAGDGDVVAVKSLVPHGGQTFLSLAFFYTGSPEQTHVAEAAVLLNVTGAQLLDAAQRTGFHATAVYGGFDRTPFDAPQSGDFVCVLTKPGPPAGI